MSDRTTTTSLIPLPTSSPAVSTSSAEPTSTSSTPQPSTSSSLDPSTSSSTTSSSPPPTSQSSSSQIDSTSSSSASPSSSSQSQSSSSTTSSESSSAQSTSSSSTQSASSSHLSTSFPVVTSNGQIYTQTAVVTIGGPTPTGGASDQSNRSTSNGFFHNKGAVAGVFAVVGIVVVVIAFVVITAAIRRRRQRKFDKEIDDAAAEAAAAPGPDFDDFDYTSGNTAGTGYGGYSDGSHGTFAQPPMSHQPGEAYNMSNIPPSQEYLAAAGAAGIGAGVGAMQRARSRRDPQDPYGSFANREPGQYEMPDAQQLRYRGNTGVPDSQNPSYDLLAAAGLQGVGNDPYALTRGASQSARAQYPPQPQSQPGVARNPSNRDALSSESHYPPSNASGQPYGQPPYYQETAPAQPQQQQARHVPAALAPGRVPADDSVYGGYLDTGATMPNPHSPRPNTPPSPVESEADLVPPDAGHLQHIVENDDSQPSLHDEEDYGYDGGRRVLRVANE